MKNKVCILAAGVGAPLQELSKNMAPSILPVNFKASISYIIEKFDLETEIIVAIGHKKETVRDYLELAYPERKFVFVEVDKYIGPGASVAHSLLSCKEYLQCPFIYFAADTIVVEDIPTIDENWLGVAPTKEPEKYCTIKTKNNMVYQINNKIKVDNKLAFIGVAGIKDFDIFWRTLENGSSESSEEDKQINAFKELASRVLVPKIFTWFDTGHKEGYIEANNSFIGDGTSFDFSKSEEFLYFVNGRVLKFFNDQNLTEKRVKRAALLDGLCPRIEGHRGNFYSYKRAEGNTLYEVINPQILNNLLHWSNQILWKRQKLDAKDAEKFKELCKKFYYDKTVSRINSFYKQNNIRDSINIINGIQTPSLKDLMEKIDWDTLFDGIPSRFHGDFTAGNILVSRDGKTNLDKFILIDWRHDFAGSEDIGDIYYDLAKLYKGIFLSDDLIKKNMFSFEISGINVYYDYFITRRLVEAREEYDRFLNESEFDGKKVRIISALCLLNMSPLHKYPFNFLLYYLGKSMLYTILNQKGSSKNDIK